VEVNIKEPHKLRLVHNFTAEVAENSPSFIPDLNLAPELIRRCLLRPTDAVAWTEFVRRFHPTIRTSVEKSFQLKETEGEDKIKHSEEMIEAVVRTVYRKLTENRCKALRHLEGFRAHNIKPYLMMMSINAVREYLRGTKL
jgi:hypothetical protein